MPASCEPYRDAISARTDGEASPVGDDALAAHLDACSSCTTFAAAVGGFGRRLRVIPAEAVPDHTFTILAAVQTPHRGRVRARHRQLRVVLALTGIAQLGLAIPLLVAGSTRAGHATREVAIFQLALGIGFIVVAWRPTRAPGLLPVTAAVAVLATVTSLGGVLAGTASLVQETAHTLELTGAGLLWALDRHLGRPRLHPADAGVAPNRPRPS